MRFGAEDRTRREGANPTAGRYARPSQCPVDGLHVRTSRATDGGSSNRDNGRATSPLGVFTRRLLGQTAYSSLPPRQW